MPLYPPNGEAGLENLEVQSAIINGEFVGYFVRLKNGRIGFIPASQEAADEAVSVIIRDWITDPPKKVGK